MPGTHKFSVKEDRQAQHIIDSEIKSGKSPEDAKAIAYGHLSKKKKKKRSKAQKDVAKRMGVKI